VKAREIIIFVLTLEKSKENKLGYAKLERKQSLNPKFELG
jgi:hypothetical protein